MLCLSCHPCLPQNPHRVNIDAEDVPLSSILACRGKPTNPQVPPNSHIYSSFCPPSTFPPNPSQSLMVWWNRCHTIRFRITIKRFGKYSSHPHSPSICEIKDWIPVVVVVFSSCAPSLIFWDHRYRVLADVRYWLFRRLTMPSRDHRHSSLPELPELGRLCLGPVPVCTQSRLSY